MRRRAILLLLPLLLSACGFAPLYGRGEALEEALRHVEIAPIGDRPGQILRNRLIDAFALAGAPAEPRYRLEVALSESISSVAIARDASVTRGQMVLTAVYRLIDLESGAPILGADSRSINAFNRLDEPFAALLTETDARERGLAELAQEIRTRVALALARVGQ